MFELYIKLYILVFTCHCHVCCLYESKKYKHSPNLHNFYHFNKYIQEVILNNNLIACLFYEMREFISIPYKHKMDRSCLMVTNVSFIMPKVFALSMTFIITSQSTGNTILIHRNIVMIVGCLSSVMV